MQDIRVVLVTVPDRARAESLCATLVDEGLVACGNIVTDVTSVYRWEGDVHRDSEALVLFKTEGSAVPELLHRIPELHPYEVPEILSLRVDEGYGPYMEWVAREVSSRTDRRSA